MGIDDCFNGILRKEGHSSLAQPRAGAIHVRSFRIRTFRKQPRHRKQFPTFRTRRNFRKVNPIITMMLAGKAVLRGNTPAVGIIHGLRTAAITPTSRRVRANAEEEGKPVPAPQSEAGREAALAPGHPASHSMRCSPSRVVSLAFPCETHLSPLLLPPRLPPISTAPGRL